jgi:hypothetical protein
LPRPRPAVPCAAPSVTSAAIAFAGARFPSLLATLALGTNQRWDHTLLFAGAGAGAGVSSSLMALALASKQRWDHAPLSAGAGTGLSSLFAALPLASKQRWDHAPGPGPGPGWLPSGSRLLGVNKRSLLKSPFNFI